LLAIDRSWEKILSSLLYQFPFNSISYIKCIFNVENHLFHVTDSLEVAIKLNARLDASRNVDISTGMIIAWCQLVHTGQKYNPAPNSR
jgi:hypothetical protein